jgi:hypothetical protein
VLDIRLVPPLTRYTGFRVALILCFDTELLSQQFPNHIHANISHCPSILVASSVEWLLTCDDTYVAMGNYLLGGFGLKIVNCCNI